MLEQQRRRTIDIEVYKFRFSKLIRDKRKELDLSLRAFADLAHLNSHSIIRAIEDMEYQQEFTAPTHHRIAQNIFKIKTSELLAYLYGETDEFQPKELTVEDAILAIKNIKSVRSCVRIQFELAKQMEELLNQITLN